MDKELKEVVEDAILEYNRYRSPEAAARLILIIEKWFKIEFKGTFCSTCGFYAYFDDYKILLQEAGLETEIVRVMEIEEGAVVDFKTVDSID